jgi:hypothetical protein
VKEVIAFLDEFLQFLPKYVNYEVERKLFEIAKEIILNSCISCDEIIRDRLLQIEAIFDEVQEIIPNQPTPFYHSGDGLPYHKALVKKCVENNDRETLIIILTNFLDQDSIRNGKPWQLAFELSGIKAMIDESSFRDNPEINDLINEIALAHGI